LKKTKAKKQNRVEGRSSFFLLASRKKKKGASKFPFSTFKPRKTSTTMLRQAASSLRRAAGEGLVRI